MKRACRTPDAPALIATVRRLYAAMERFDTRAADAIGIDRTALKALDVIEPGALTASELGAALGLTSGSVTALVDRMQRQGLAVRHADEADRRQRRIAIAPRARRAAEPHFARLGAAIVTAMQALEPTQQAAAVAVLDALAQAFDAAAAKPKAPATRRRPRAP